MSVPVALIEVLPAPVPQAAATLLGGASRLGGLQPSGCGRRVSHQRSGAKSGPLRIVFVDVSPAREAVGTRQPQGMRHTLINVRSSRLAPGV